MLLNGLLARLNVTFAAVTSAYMYFPDGGQLQLHEAFDVAGRHRLGPHRLLRPRPLHLRAIPQVRIRTKMYSPAPHLITHVYARALSLSPDLLGNGNGW